MDMKLKKKYTEKKGIIRNGSYHPRTGSRPIKGKSYSNPKLRKLEKKSFVQ